jgi:hypothetical protein
VDCIACCAHNAESLRVLETAGKIGNQHNFYEAGSANVLADFEVWQAYETENTTAADWWRPW